VTGKTIEERNEDAQTSCHATPRTRTFATPSHPQTHTLCQSVCLSPSLRHIQHTPTLSYYRSLPHTYKHSAHPTYTQHSAHTHTHPRNTHTQPPHRYTPTYTSPLTQMHPHTPTPHTHLLSCMALATTEGVFLRKSTSCTILSDSDSSTFLNHRSFNAI
jgi:hypothetical protein